MWNGRRTVTIRCGCSTRRRRWHWVRRPGIATPELTTISEFGGGGGALLSLKWRRPFYATYYVHTSLIKRPWSPLRNVFMLFNLYVYKYFYSLDRWIIAVHCCCQSSMVWCSWCKTKRDVIALLNTVKFPIRVRSCNLCWPQACCKVSSTYSYNILLSAYLNISS